MIGLPSETDEDVKEILLLAKTDSPSDSFESEGPREEMEVSLKRQPLYPQTGYALSVGAFGRSRGIEEEVEDDSEEGSGARKGWR